MFYLVKTPAWVEKLYPRRLWSVKTDQKHIYLSFDDGPHPEHTVFVLDELKKYNAKATFFCIGNNVVLYPEVYQRILDEGHSVGNHTYDHLNASKVSETTYLENIRKAKDHIDSELFRPPYGKINSFLVKQLLAPVYRLTTVMWTVLSGDFDTSISKERCLENVLLHAEAGSIVVFHDSEKASEKMRYALPEVLKQFTGRGFSFKNIGQNS
jgi:peptidoglycan/xylan/chitin deacetylase (PgdA/CDA1 family)